MVDFDHVLAVKETFAGRLLASRGVHAVGIGAKWVAGQRTSEPAILVFVVKKKPLTELEASDVVPPVLDGVKTDVIETPLPELKADDDREYRPLKGGVRTIVGAETRHGTFGCIGLIPADQRIVGITCWHVVGSRDPQPTSLKWQYAVTTAGQRIEFFSEDEDGNTQATVTPAGTTVYVGIHVFVGLDPAEQFDFWVQSATGDTASTVARKVRDEIAGLADPRFDAVLDGNRVTVRTLGTPVVVIDPDTSLAAFGPPAVDPEAKLQAKVVGDTITLSGSASTEFYGIYVRLNVSGPQRASQGTFLPVTKGQSLTSMATALAASLSGVPGLTATASGKTVTITSPDPDQIDCYVWRDIRVGQDDNGFGSLCCGWCSDRIGTVIRARWDLDAALVQLDGKLKYRPEIVDIGAISGVHHVTPAEAVAGLAVRKRGFVTQATNGNVLAINADGIIGKPFRRYRQALMIQSATSGPFSEKGDSGSAIVVSSGSSHQIAGLLFGGGTQIDFATPIAQILSAFNIQIKTGAPADPDQEVPALAALPAESTDASLRTPTGPLRRRVEEMEREIATTGSGRHYVQMARRHMGEAQKLVNENRRVSVAWQRHGGPVLVRAILDSIRSPEQPLPERIVGRPLDQCLNDIADAFRPHASRSFLSDLDHFASAVSGLGGKNYAELLARLRAADRALSESLSDGPH
jgi:hypothetical protein